MASTQPNAEPSSQRIDELVEVVSRVVRARVRDPDLVEDLVQETLLRVMGARGRIDDAAVIPYGLVIARNLVTSAIRLSDRADRHAHLLVAFDQAEPADEQVLRAEERDVVSAALARLSPRERDALVAHELDGKDTATLAETVGSTPAAIAAQLNRARAKLRVEYLLALERAELPTARCRPVLLALSGRDRRRQRELDTAGHLLECASCALLSQQLLKRRQRSDGDGERIVIESDLDVVKARQKGREVAAQVGFSATESTSITTAISEIARNIVRFAHRGELSVTVVAEHKRRGVCVVARDSGPGIADIERALRAGYSSYGGLGLGLAGCRRLMDEFDIVSHVGRGTIVTMKKWRPARPR